MDKSKLLQALKGIVSERLTEIEDQLAALSEALNSSSKSSAGDKHETSRAMVHLEQEQLSKQLLQYQSHLAGISKVPDLTTSTVQYGSLIETNKGLYFIAVGLGKQTVLGKDVFCLSGNAPIVQNTLLGKKLNDVIKLGDQQLTITDIQ